MPVNTLKKIKRRRRHLSRRSFLKNLRRARRFKRRSRKWPFKVRLQRAIKRRKFNLDLQKLKYGCVILKVLRRNTFINISTKVRIQRNRKKKNRFEVQSKKKTYLRVVYATSMGHLKYYKGRARSSAVARRELALQLLKYLLKNNSYCRFNLNI